MVKLTKHIPNGITLVNLVLGCFAILSVFRNDLYEAGILILFAALADFLDGVAARIFKAKSDLGLQLDSLADLVSFGVAPGFIVFKMFELHAGFTDNYTWLRFIAFLIPVCSAIRLAKFNIDTRQKNSFLGLPVPANAILIASFHLIYFQEASDFTWLTMVITNHWFLMAFAVLFSLLLVSEIPLIALKFDKNGPANRLRLVFTGLSILSLALFYFKGILLIILIYFIISIGNYFVNRKP